MTIAQEWLDHAPGPRPLKDGFKWHVFLSYRSVNRTWVLNLYDVLREAGYAVFLDQVVLKAGDSLIRQLEDGLDRSQAGVLVWSSATADSEWVRREYEVMESRTTDDDDFHFVPIRLEDTGLPSFAKRRIFLDFSAYPDGPNGGELLRLLHAIGGKALSDEAAHFAVEQDEAAQAAGNAIKAAILNGNAQRLVALHDEDGLPWRSSAALPCRAAEGLTRLDAYDEAIAMLEATEGRFPKAIRPKQLRALALARRGVKLDREADLEAAQEILGELYAAGERDPETLGIFGRTWMDRYNRSGDERHLRQSYNYYAEAFEGATDDYYTGINAAAKSVFLGGPEDLENAARIAARVQEIVGDQPWPDDYWQTATVAEVMLIQKKYAEAAELYRAAVDMAPNELGSHGSTWGQARLLMEKLQPTPEERAPIAAAFAHLED